MNLDDVVDIVFREKELNQLLLRASIAGIGVKFTREALYVFDDEGAEILKISSPPADTKLLVSTLTNALNRVRASDAPKANSSKEART
jgi:hypothetical protein